MTPARNIMILGSRSSLLVPSWPKRTLRRRHQLVSTSFERSIRSINISAIIAPPVIFTGLFLALWTWKCMMLVVFQNMIIYNPFLPPNSRSLTIAEYAKECLGIKWREERIESADGTEIALCVADVARGAASEATTHAYILYFQGNASSLPPRLPDISSIMKRVTEISDSVAYTVVCISYRGYWTSHDRPSERGINQDTVAALQWISRLSRGQGEGSEVTKKQSAVVLWGQSIGCGFATNLAASPTSPGTLPIRSLVLETPFTNTRAMLKALYPQKWLPYQYLWPFLRTHLDSWRNLATLAQQTPDERPSIYLIEAGNDELVPGDHGKLLEERCKDLGLQVVRRTVRSALHNEASVRREGKQAIAESIVQAVRSTMK